MKAIFVAIIALFCLPFVANAQDAKWDPLRIYPTDIVFGASDAPVTIVEYASLTCPHCATFHKDVWPQVKKDWVMTGKAKLVFRSMAADQSALAGAMTAVCVPNEFKEQVISALFDTTIGWATDNSKIVGVLHNRLGNKLNYETIIKCMAQENLGMQIMAPMVDGMDNGVSSTPTFFINGTKIEGVKTPFEIGKLIQTELDKTKP